MIRRVLYFHHNGSRETLTVRQAAREYICDYCMRRIEYGELHASSNQGGVHVHLAHTKELW